MTFHRRFRLWVLLALAALCAAAVPARSAFREWRREVRLQSQLFTPEGQLEHFTIEPDFAQGEEERIGGERESPALRRLLGRVLSGDPTIESRERTLRAAQREASRWGHLLPGSGLRVPLGGQSWLNLGPTDSVATTAARVDSGRVTTVAVHPQNPDVVYVATSGGGVWKSFDFEQRAPNPTWLPITESLGSQAIGALALDPGQPDTVYLGVGDAWDTSGNAVFKSTSGGARWAPPVFLSGTYQPGTGPFVIKPASIRGIQVDPDDSNVVLVATGAGLFRSSDAGKSYALIDLPETDAQGLAESVWSLVYLGRANHESVWIASGIQACDVARRPPAWMGVVPGATSYEDGKPCTFGNKGHLWRSSDSGRTWLSLRDAGVLPLADVGRLSVAAGKVKTPTTTALYVLVGSLDDERGLGVWRSLNGGLNFDGINGVLANPQEVPDCYDWPDLLHNQAWYNQAITVDPTSDDHVLVGGQLCGVRSVNATSSSPSWEGVAVWGYYYGALVPYVHADWHTALASTVGGKLRVFVGGDGGLFSSTNVFTAPPTKVDWASNNRGIASHLCYSVGSGDPATGNPYPVLTGLQDNGSRMRDYPRWESVHAYSAGDVVAPSTASGHLYRCSTGGISAGAEPTWVTTPGAQVADGSVTWVEAGPLRATTFNEVTGGDGFGTAVNKGTAGEWLWASVQYTRFFCQPAKANCNAQEAWTQSDPSPGGGDQMPFMTWLEPIQSDPTGVGVLTVTERAVWKTTLACPAGVTAPCWQQVGPQLPSSIRSVSASTNVPKLYGVALSGGLFAVTSDEQTWTVSAPIGTSGPYVFRFATAIAFPPVTPAGRSPGDVYAVSTTNGATVSGITSYVFLTEDRGQSFVPIPGAPGKELPDAAVRALRYDPGDESGLTLYAGTELGVYRTTDGGLSWERFGHGLPLVRVDAIFLSRTSSLMRIATYGRGLWEIWPNAFAHRGVAGSGDFDGNQLIDWRDLGAAAARLGTTPATTSWPAYDWVLDLDGRSAVNHIDEGDLALLVDRFGGRP